jgi:hypothetical protein
VYEPARIRVHLRPSVVKLPVANPFVICHNPDSKKWGVRAPERRVLRGEALDYYDGEE